MKDVIVLIPSYEPDMKLIEVLEDVKKNNLEVIVVNDGSPDNSQKIIDKYSKKYKNVFGYKKKNGGLSDARNYGISKSCGEYISFVDSDDYVDITMLEKMYNKAKKEELDIVVCDNIEVYDDKLVLKKANLNYSSNVLKNYIISPPMAWCRIYKRELFDMVEFEKGIYYEDLNLMPSLVKYTSKIGFLEEGLYYYVQRDNSIMKQNVFSDKLLDLFKVLDNNKNNLYDMYPEEVEYLYITHLLRSDSLRFVDFENARNLLDRIVTVIKAYFPNYWRNIYFKKCSLKLKLICFLAYFKQVKLLKLVKKVSGK